MVEIDVSAGSRQVSRQLGALGVLLILMAIGLVLNSLLGPAFGNLIHYPVSETMRNQTMGLELFSLLLLVPPSVALMAIVMLWNDDPFADVVTVLILVASAAVFGWLAYQLYRPLLRRRAPAP